MHRVSFETTPVQVLDRLQKINHTPHGERLADIITGIEERRIYASTRVADYRAVFVAAYSLNRPGFWGGSDL